MSYPGYRARLKKMKFKTWADKKREYKEKEKELENKIRDLRMSRARKTTPKKKEMPAEKRRKLTSNSFTAVKQDQTNTGKRKTSENITGDTKRRRSHTG